MTQDRMADADMDKVDANVKSDAPDASKDSNINTTNMDVKRGMGKRCAVVISLS